MSIATTLTTFPLFSSLPLELQIEIFELASTGTGEPRDNVISRVLIDNVIISHTHGAGKPMPGPYARALKKAETGIFVAGIRGKSFRYTTLKSLLGTCRLSREVALLEWKKDVMKHQLSSRWANHYRQMMESVKAQFIETLDKLIDDVRGTRNTRRD